MFAHDSTQRDSVVYILSKDICKQNDNHRAFLLQDSEKFLKCHSVTNAVISGVTMVL